MKYKFNIVILISFLGINSKAQTKLSDTIFIKQTHNQIIYIVNDKKSTDRSSVLDFNSTKEDKANVDRLFNKYKYLIEKSSKKTNSINSKWVEIKSYKKKYYLYKPCDLYYSYKFIINKKNIIEEYTGEGLEGKLITSVRIDSYNTISFTAIDYEMNKTLYRIKTISSKKGIAELTIKNGNVSIKKIIADVSKSAYFPLIINECKSEKADELDFDKR